MLTLFDTKLLQLVQKIVQQFDTSKHNESTVYKTILKPQRKGGTMLDQIHILYFKLCILNLFSFLFSCADISVSFLELSALLVCWISYRSRQIHS